MKVLNTVVTFTVVLLHLVNSAPSEYEAREIPPTMTECLSKLAINMAQYTPDFHGAFCQLHHLLQQHFVSDAELQRMAEEKKNAEVWPFVANAKQFLEHLSEATIFKWFCVVVVGGVVCTIRYWPKYVATVPVKQQERQADPQWGTEWRSSLSVYGTDSSDEDEIIKDGYGWINDL